MNARLLAVAAVLAVVTGCSVAYCQHQDDAPPSDECAGVMWAAPAGTKTKTPRTVRQAPREVHRAPSKERSAPAVRKPSPRPSASPTPHHRRSHVDIDLELGGC